MPTVLRTPDQVAAAAERQVPPNLPMWQQAMGMNSAELARALGVSHRLIRYWRTGLGPGESPLPKWLPLALATLRKKRKR